MFSVLRPYFSITYEVFRNEGHTKVLANHPFGRCLCPLGKHHFQLENGLGGLFVSDIHRSAGVAQPYPDRSAWQLIPTALAYAAAKMGMKNFQIFALFAVAEIAETF